MGPHLFIHETLRAERRQALLHEREQQHLAHQSDINTDGIEGDVRHVVALFGLGLVALGTRLQRVEPVLYTNSVVRRATIPLKETVSYEGEVHVSIDYERPGEWRGADCDAPGMPGEWHCDRGAF